MYNVADYSALALVYNAGVAGANLAYMAISLAKNLPHKPYCSPARQRRWTVFRFGAILTRILSTPSVVCFC